jgi:ATP-binding cassette, subfamily B, bacterial
MSTVQQIDKKKEISFARIIFRLFPMVLASCPLLFIFGNIVGIIHGASWGFNTFVSQLFFDAVAKAVTEKSDVGIVVWMALALGAAAIGSQILNGIHNFMSATFFNKMSGFLGIRINEKASRIDPILYETPVFLDDINKASEGMNNSLGLLFTFTTIFTFYLPYFLFMGIYLFTLKPILALSLVLVFVPVAITQLIRGIVFAKLEDQAAPIRREYEYYERCICDREYFKETRLLGGFAFFKNLYVSALSILREKTWNAELKTGIMELGMKLITLIGYFGVLYLLFTALLNNEISIGTFAAVFASIDGMFMIMEEIICRHIGSMTKNLGTVRNFIRFLEFPERQGMDMTISAGDGIVLEKVSFRYPEAKADSLNDISLEVKKGETIAIVGENGAGKTTLVKLMTGIYLPTSGSVLIDNVNTKEVSPKSIYNGISAVFQKFQKYKMTLGENIHISDIESSMDRESTGELVYENRLKDSIQKSDLILDEENFPKGYDTMLSREFDGVDLSGGQWQRAAIARGFYRAHGMIVLDEPTAAIDPIEETNIYKKFSEISKGKTSIIVTHRLGSAKIADRIVVMDNGKIADIGTHDELMKAEGKYSEMFNAQAQWYVL